ncbi:MAG: glycosyltransferase family 2 protein [Chloroflexi bacterium]|nr:glycosyltransferase family 2 protein [Chloroflexota bacterium]MCL5108078.1 glycosyltransferase family 2 protein [Chloroflexota bacterium]
MAPKVVVIVLNWNGVHFLRDCLGALARQTYVDKEVVLVDNGSSDGSLALVQAEFAGVRLLRNQRNLGFAAANNQAIAATQSEFVALLNNDTQVEPDWLAQLVGALESDPRLGSCASQMLFAQRPGIINSAGIALDRAGIAWDRWGGRSAQDAPAEPGEVFGPCAGAALYRRALFADVGGFDEDFFAYLEDVDLAWRARLRGWGCRYVPQAKVLHCHSGTSKEGSPFKSFLLGRNKLWTIVKNYPVPEVWRYLPAIGAYDLGSVQYSALLRGDLSPARGRLAALAGVPRMLRKRRAIQARRTVTSSDLLRLMEPLARPDRVASRYRHLEQLIRE